MSQHVGRVDDDSAEEWEMLAVWDLIGQEIKTCAEEFHRTENARKTLPVARPKVSPGSSSQAANVEFSSSDSEESGGSGDARNPKP